jgi:DNA-binding transcriptional ArsR family regulator
MKKLFKALDDPTRRKIIDLLKERDMNAGEIAEAFQMTKPSVSYHLDLLKQADLVESEKQGQFVLYSLNTSVLEELISWAMSVMDRPKDNPENTQKP